MSGAGSNDAGRDELLAAVYDELRRASARLLKREVSYLTLEPTELVNEAVMKVIGLDRMDWRDRQHMFATCSRLLRQSMIDAIRRRRASKRQVPEVGFVLNDAARPVDIERLDDTLNRLDALSPELSRIVELRFFVGLTVEEIAAVTGQSERTVKRRWQTARLWLADAMAED
ncbi:ECF-type sigma factor [Erythrobacter oryzae]|uniref:ECF-type sigma factor n=1 Tax=Erythrobacter oryzae TaxID=3019556 RepID=UPI002555C845|nr:ECF-type sigma factor [Erythrobacter sp. COR-2]